MTTPHHAPTAQASTSASSPRFRWRLLTAGPLMLDGGSMFGVVPRVVWTRTLEPNDANQITLCHNLLLLESVAPFPGRNTPHRVLIEAGSGDKLPPKMRSIFGLGPDTAESAVRACGISPQDIDDVIVTHLHFDHAGGLTRLPRDGETADWTGDDRGGGGAKGSVVTFPNARVHVQRREWQDAINNTAVMTRTYYLDHLLPIERHLTLADSPPPFDEGGMTPKRDAMPASPLEDRWTIAAPGIRVFRVPGHTWGQQAVHFTDDAGREVVFAPDVLPTVHHIGAAYSLAYDVEPYISMVSKHWFLSEAADRGWLLVLDHEPATPRVTVHRDGKGWFELRPEPSGST